MSPCDISCVICTAKAPLLTLRGILKTWSELEPLVSGHIGTQESRLEVARRLRWSIFMVALSSEGQCVCWRLLSQTPVIQSPVEPVWCRNCCSVGSETWWATPRLNPYGVFNSPMLHSSVCTSQHAVSPLFCVLSFFFLLIPTENLLSFSSKYQLSAFLDNKTPHMSNKAVVTGGCASCSKTLWMRALSFFFYFLRHPHSLS